MYSRDEVEKLLEKVRQKAFASTYFELDEWVKENLTPNTDVILVNKKDKQLYAGENKILIDDRTDNISDWKNAGGIGILHKTATQTINELKKLGL